MPEQHRQSTLRTLLPRPSWKRSCQRAEQLVGPLGACLSLKRTIIALKVSNSTKNIPFRALKPKSRDASRSKVRDRLNETAPLLKRGNLKCYLKRHYLVISTPTLDRRSPAEPKSALEGRNIPLKVVTKRDHRSSVVMLNVLLSVYSVDGCS